MTANKKVTRASPKTAYSNRLLLKGKQMFIYLSLNCAKKISLDTIDIDVFKNMRDVRSLDLGICAVYRVPLRDSDQCLYIESLDSTATVSHSLADWMDQCWEGGSKDYACGDF